MIRRWVVYGLTVAMLVGVALLWGVAGLRTEGADGADEPQRDVVPLRRTHAHNDYYQPRPLFDALDHGFCSVEADIFLVDGELLVAHTAREIEPGRTLQALYLDPLRERIRANGGQVYRGHEQTLVLLIDIKSNGNEMWPVLHQVLAEYADILTVVEHGRLKPGPVHAIISGSRPIELMAQEEVLYAGVDGRMSDLAGDRPAHFMPLVSDHWFRHFRWRGRGEMPEAERDRLRALIEQAHDKGYMVRFWATPEEPELWRVLIEHDVDMINTDHLTRLRDFLLAEDPQVREQKGNAPCGGG